jgi:hydroxylysine kinase
VVRGYTSVSPLTEAEVALIPALVAGRLAMTLAITARRARQHPENRAYILRNAPAAFKGLVRLLDAPPGRAEVQFRRAAGMTP